MSVKVNVTDIVNNLNDVCKKNGRDPSEITIIAVTKYVTIERAKEAVEAGITNLGENRLEGFQEKYSEIGKEAIWHFIGSLQTRKVKELADKIDFLHSLDRVSLAKELDKRLEKPLNCFVQVNTSGEDSKHGLNPETTVDFIEELKAYSNLQVIGLMTMAPLTDEEKIIRESFRQLRKIRDEVKEKHWEHAPCPYLSMGMSNDYHIAVEEGATHIRIGTALVGTS